MAGIFAAIPIGVTAFVIIYANDIASRIFHINIPGVGIVLAVVALYLLGLIVTSVLGKIIINRLDRLFGRMPMLKEVYQAWKHILVTPGGSEGIFAKVVLIPGDVPGSHIVGFSSGEPVNGDSDTCCVFVPAAPNPTNGRLYFLPRSSIRFLDISNEEAFKMILSGGNYLPIQTK